MVISNSGFEIGSNVSKFGLYDRVPGWEAFAALGAGRLIIKSGSLTWGGLAAAEGSHFLGLYRSLSGVKKLISGHKVGKEYQLRLYAARQEAYPESTLKVSIGADVLGNFVPTSSGFALAVFSYVAKKRDVQLKVENVRSKGTIFVDAISVQDKSVVNKGCNPNDKRFFVEVVASKHDGAGSKNGVSVQFRVGKVWTKTDKLCQRVSYGGVCGRSFNFPSWPELVRLLAGGPDGVGLKSVALRKGCDERRPLQSANGRPFGRNAYWLGSGGQLPGQLELVVDPALQDPRLQKSAKVSPDGNAGLHKPVSMSCGPWSTFVGNYATDGSTCNRIYTPNCGAAHTCKQKDAWMQVDLQTGFRVSHVVVWNAWEHCCRARINPFVVRFFGISGLELGRSAPQKMHPLLRHEAKRVDSPTSHLVRYVRIELANHTNYLVVAELQVFVAK